MEKDNKEELTTQKDNDISSALAVFINPTNWYLYKKSEKISKAFFLLTRHMPEEQVLKTRMREKALDLLAKAQGLLAEGGVKDVTSKVVLEALALISLSDTALSGELQSERNHSIIVKELNIFIKDLSTWADTKTEAGYIPTSLFDMSDISYAAPAAEVGKSLQAKKPALKTTQPVRSPIKERAVSDTTHTDIRKGTRQDSILNIIRNQGEVSIKDLVAVIKGCSEKTIQRELISLVNEGRLSKTGERRWSRYSLAAR